MTRTTAARIYLALAAVTLLFHTALVLGAPFGAATMAGRWPGALPVAGRIAAAVSIAVLLVMGRIVAEAGDLAVTWIPPASLWAVALFLGLEAALLAITPASAERAIWLPQILVQGACVVRLLRA